jgi:hypothetical protein
MPVPEKIVIDGKEYSLKDNPELMDLVQEVRKEEKDKLYSKISTTEAKIKVLEDEKKSTGDLSTKKDEELQKLKDDLAVTKKEKLDLEAEIKKGKKADDDDDEDDDKKKGKKQPSSGLSKDDVASIVADALAKQQEGFDKKLEEVTGKLGKKTVADYKKEQLAKYKDVIIEDFVPENLDSEEAVNKAIEKALEKSKQYIRKEVDVDGTKKSLTLSEIEELEAKKDKGDKGSGGGDGSGEGKKNPPAKPDGGSGDLTGKELLSKIEDMTDEEYAKHADAILKEVKSVKYQDGNE